MKMADAKKVDFHRQQARLEKAAKDLNPDCDVYFETSNDPLWVVMRVDDPPGTILYQSPLPPKQVRYGAIADLKADDELKNLLRKWRDQK
jgi:hypothetical protein